MGFVVRPEYSHCVSERFITYHFRVNKISTRAGQNILFFALFIMGAHQILLCHHQPALGLQPPLRLGLRWIAEFSDFSLIKNVTARASLYGASTIIAFLSVS